MAGYRLQIIDPDDAVVLSWPAGHPVERDLADAIMDQAKQHGLGYFKSEAHVAEAIRQAVGQAVFALKSDVHPRRA